MRHRLRCSGITWAPNSAVAAGAPGDDAIAITGHYSAVATACPGDRSLVLVQQRCNLAAGPGDRMQAYGLDVSDLGTAVIASVEDATNPLAPGAKIDAFNCDADGQGYTKVRWTPSSRWRVPCAALSEPAWVPARCTPCEGLRDHHAEQHSKLGGGDQEAAGTRRHVWGVCRWWWKTGPKPGTLWLLDVPYPTQVMQGTKHPAVLGWSSKLDISAV